MDADATEAALPSIRLRQATSSTLQIADSDDEEGLEELAVEEETSYWTNITADQSSSPLPSSRAFGVNEQKDTVVLFDPVSPHRQEPEEPHLASASPDPLDLLGRQYEEDSASFAVLEDSQVIQDSDEEMPSQELDSDVELLRDGVNKQDTRSPETRQLLESDQSASPQLPPALGKMVASDSDDDLPTLSQAFPRTQITKSSPRVPLEDHTLAPYDRDETRQATGRDGVRLVAVESTPTSASSREGSSSRRDEADSQMNSPPTPVHPELEAPVLEEPHQQGRALRKRTQAQLQPYTTDWMKFAKTAQRNQWGDLVTKEAMYGAQHRPETEAEIAARLNKLKAQKVHTHGGWLEPDEGRKAMRPEEEERLERMRSLTSRLPEDSDYQAVSPRPRARSRSTSRRPNGRKGSSVISDSDEGLPDIVIARSIRGELTQGGARRPKARKNGSSAKERQVPTIDNASASSSRITVEDQLREESYRGKSKKKRSSRTEAIMKALVRGRAQSEPGSSPRQAEEQYERANSSSPPRISSARRNKKPRLEPGSRQAQGHDTPSNAAFRRYNQQLSESEESEEDRRSSEDDSDDAEEPNGDSPERPNLPAEDRFALKGKRKKAAKAMMPAIFFRKAEKDLALMREERKTGVIKHTLDRERSEDEDDDGTRQRAQARVRINPRNANKPIRFIADESTSESDGASIGHGDSEPEEVETQQALRTWTSMAQARNRSKEGPGDRSTGKGYWSKVIGNILVRDKLERQGGLQSKGRGKQKRTSGSARKAGADGRSDNGIIAPKRPLTKQKRLDQFYVFPTHLDDADSLFAAVPPRNSEHAGHSNPPLRKSFRRQVEGKGTALETLSYQILPAALPKPRPLQTPSLDSNDVWSGTGASYSRFSFDFDIQPLLLGTTFPPNGYIGKGYLHELTKPVNEADLPRRRTAVPFGIQLDNEMEAEVFLTFLPRVCDAIYEECISESPPASLLDSSTGEALRFIICYLSDGIGSELTSAEAEDRTLAELEHAESRLSAWTSITDMALQASRNLLVFKWYMLELAYRRCLHQHGRDAHTFAAEEAAAQFLDRLGDLTQALVSLGLREPMQTVQALRETSEADTRCISDLLCEIWVCIIHLFISAPLDLQDGILSQQTFWSVIECHCSQNAADRALHPILKGELDCYTVMALCCLSQFSINGLATSQVGLREHWQFYHTSIDRIKPQEFARSYSAMSNTGRTRASRYIWTLYARCLLLSTRWNWQLLGQSKLLGKLYEILNARELQDMSIEGQADFPSFLSDFAGAVGTTIERDDTVFRLLLRIIARVALEARADGSEAALGILNRLTLRITPMREQLSYPRKATAGIVRKNRSVLVNHYSLHVLLAAVDATNAAKRFIKFKAILNLNDADVRAWQDCLRAVTYLGIVYLSRGMDIMPITAWLAELAVQLHNRYGQILRQRTSLEGAGSERSVPPAGKWNALKVAAVASTDNAGPTKAALARLAQEMGENAVMMGVLLGAVQQLIKATSGETKTAYPSLSLLNAAWIKDVLESPLARDPVVGSQVLSCVNEFLSARQKAVPARGPPPLARESQDEYGDFDFDYDDPALNAMLGVEAPSTMPDQQSDKALLETQEAELCRLLKNDLSPAVYRLLSNLNSATDGLDNAASLPIVDRQAYIADLVETWTGCASVLVQYDQQDWSTYMGEYGKESWQRISDKTAKYEVGLHFAYGMLQADENAYRAQRDLCIELLLRGLTLASAPHCLPAYLSRLLNIDADLLLWRHVPYQRDPLTYQYEISDTRLAATRLPLLREIFKDCKDILCRRFCRGPAAGADASEGLEGLEVGSDNDIVDVMRNQKLDGNLVYKLLGSLCANMRDQVDALEVQKESFMKIQDYRALCKEIAVSLMIELGPSLANERLIPSLRLLAGIISSN